MALASAACSDRDVRWLELPPSPENAQTMLTALVSPGRLEVAVSDLGNSDRVSFATTDPSDAQIFLLFFRESLLELGFVAPGFVISEDDPFSSPLPIPIETHESSVEDAEFLPRPDVPQPLASFRVPDRKFCAKPVELTVPLPATGNVAFLVNLDDGRALFATEPPLARGTPGRNDEHVFALSGSLELTELDWPVPDEYPRSAFVTGDGVYFGGARGRVWRGVVGTSSISAEPIAQTDPPEALRWADGSSEDAELEVFFLSVQGTSYRFDGQTLEELRRDEINPYNQDQQAIVRIGPGEALVGSASAAQLHLLRDGRWRDVTLPGNEIGVSSVVRDPSFGLVATAGVRVFYSADPLREPISFRDLGEAPDLGLGLSILDLIGIPGGFLFAGSFGEIGKYSFEKGSFCPDRWRTPFLNGRAILRLGDGYLVGADKPASVEETVFEFVRLE